MKILIIILLILVLIIAILLIIALFVKKDYAVRREILINKPSLEIFDYVKYLKNQDNFSKWAMMDTEMKKNYNGTDGTAGFVAAWDSKNKNVGKGEQQIKTITQGKRIDYEIRFVKPFEAIAEAAIITEPLPENKTLVKWTFNSSMKYPMNIMLLFMNMDKLLGKDLQTGLTNLKELMEK